MNFLKQNVWYRIYNHKAALQQILTVNILEKDQFAELEIGVTTLWKPSLQHKRKV